MSALVALPAVALAAAAFPRLASGLALEAAFPVPVYVTANVKLEAADYENGSNVLAGASDADGQTRIVRAEAAYLAGMPAADVLPILKFGLNEAPASARGWALLAELETPRNPNSAGKALGLSLQIAPFDYWLVAWRAGIGTDVWNVMALDDRQALLRQLRLMWSEPQWQGLLPALQQTERGAALVGEAFVDSPETLRELNRRATREGLRDFVAP